ncbi:MAG TPA: ATP-binding cassette domain-containing protein [Candidatus Nitrosotenuis sp.]|jgi:ATP-binding cassette subfamily C protein/ATP-binding cassette subfamily C protein LapB|nr:ATP-binding cassette domain-containing protein [Candidatus Nitrosotenuis sp.]
MREQLIKFAEIIKAPEVLEDVFQKAGQKGILQTAYGRCLVHILAALKWEGEIWHLTKSMPHMAEDFDEIATFNCLTHLGYKTESSEMELNNLDKRLLPSLFIPTDQKNALYPWVVLRENNDKFEIYDSESNTIKIIERSSLVRGIAHFFVFIKNQDFYYDQFIKYDTPTSLQWFRDVLKRFKRLIYQAFVLSIFINLMGVLTSVFVLLIYDKVIIVNDLRSLPGLAFSMLVILGIEYYFRTLRQEVVAWFGTRIDAVVAPSILHRILSLPPRLTEAALIPAQLARIRDFDSIRDFFKGPLVIATLEVPITLLLIGVMWAIAGRLAIIPLLALILYVALAFFLLPKTQDTIEVGARNSSKRHNLIVETVNKVKQIKFFGDHQVWIDRFRIDSGNTAYTTFQSNFLGVVRENIAYTIFTLTGLSTLMYGAHLVLIHQISLGVLIASMLLVWRILAPLQVVFISFSVFVHLRNSILQVDQLFLMQPESPSIKVFVKSPQTAPAIRFSNIFLRHYNNPQPTFSGLNVHINPGEIMMVVGHNGTGKSSLLKLVNGMYVPNSGSIKINDIDLRQYEIPEMRRTIGYVPQTAEFFYGTIAQNLRLAQPAASDDDLQNVLKSLGCWSTVASFKEGLNHRIGDAKTDFLPSSFIYQLSLARSILRDAPIMLIDEAPYSFIYSPESSYFLKYLEQWRGHKTTIMVAQREEILELADKVIFLVGDGRVLFGSPGDIIKLIKNQYGFVFGQE